jgi:hypothetical protein
MIELLLPFGFDTLQYSWVKATIGICMLVDYSMSMKCQHAPSAVLSLPSSLCLEKRKRDGKKKHQEKGNMRKQHDLEAVPFPSPMSHGRAGFDSFHR